MSVVETAAKIIGMEEDGKFPSTTWLHDPFTPLTTILSGDEQRQALLDLLDQLWPPHNPAGIANNETWHPILGPQTAGNLHHFTVANGTGPLTGVRQAVQPAATTQAHLLRKSSNPEGVMDRGMVSAESIEFLKRGGRRYILGTPRGMLRKFEQQLLDESWKEVHAGLEVKLCLAPEGQAVFILCRSGQRRSKERAMHDRFEQRIEQRLVEMAAGCRQRKQDPLLVAQRLGKLLGRNSGAAGLFRVHIKTDARGGAHLEWNKREGWRDWPRLSEGCYLPRSNVTDWRGEELWRAYIQLTEAEAAFRIHKSDLVLRPLWYHLERRVPAHILVYFLTYVLWKTFGHCCLDAGLGDEPRQIFAELGQIALVDVARAAQPALSEMLPWLHRAP